MRDFYPHHLHTGLSLPVNAACQPEMLELILRNFLALEFFNFLFQFEDILLIRDGQVAGTWPVFDVRY